MMIRFSGTHEEYDKAGARFDARHERAAATVTSAVRRGSINLSEESLVVGRAEELPDCLSELACWGTSHEGTVRRLAEPRADQIEVIGTIGLLQYLKAEIAIDSTRGGGKFEQRPLDSRPVLCSDVHVRDDVESCSRVDPQTSRCVILVELAIQSPVGRRSEIIRKTVSKGVNFCSTCR
jgi:hypothetical protein